MNADENTQVGVELHQSGPRNKPSEVTLHIITPVRQEPYHVYDERYKLKPNSDIVMLAVGIDDRYRPLSTTELKERLPLLEKVVQKLDTPESVSTS